MATALLAGLALAGCGGPSAEETAQQDWEARTGHAWDTHVKAYRTGWVRGCVEGAGWLRDLRPRDQPEPRGPSCGIVPSTPSDYLLQLPLSPPDDPETEGYDHGYTEGCTEAFRQLSEDDDRPCFLTAVNLNAKERFVYPREQP